MINVYFFKRGGAVRGQGTSRSRPSSCPCFPSAGIPGLSHHAALHFIDEEACSETNQSIHPQIEVARIMTVQALLELLESGARYLS